MSTKLNKHLKKQLKKSPSKSPKKINSIRCLNKTLQPNNIRSPRKKPLNKSKKSPN